MHILDFLFPKKCAGCGRTGTYFCSKCILSSKLRFPRAAGPGFAEASIAFGDARQVCPVCEKASLDGRRHGHCGTAYSPDGLTAVWAYEGAPKKLIGRLKYRFVKEAALSLASAAAGILKNISSNRPDTPRWDSKQVLVPVPLHWTRKNWRGFNHVEETGKVLAQLMGWEGVFPLVRKKRTRPQVGLKGEDRKNNVAGIFEISPLYITLQENRALQCADKLKRHRHSPFGVKPWALIQGECHSKFSIPDSILLFDDVWTTGATMREATKLLKKAGAKRVWCLVLAR